MSKITISKVLKSKTILFNAAVLALGIATAVTPEIQNFIEPEAYGVLLAVISILNKVLRVITTNAIGDK